MRWLRLVIPAVFAVSRVFSALVGNPEFTLDRLNPQTQERVFPG
jgi:hypothetical protein